MVINNDRVTSWGSRRTYLMVVLCQTMGTPMFVELANAAIVVGSTGYVLGYIACSLFAGIPLLYMEFIIAQFTARDSLSVWRARPCLSHVGYIIAVWQIINIVYNHVVNSFILHYLLISFENPIPYYSCGSWSSENCNILTYNFTVNEDCLRLRNPLTYCAYLYTSFPEYQYWRYRIMAVGTPNTIKYHIAWRVCLASALTCAVTYLSIFRRKRSMQLVVEFFTLFPIVGYFVLLMSSMVQKGVVVKYNDALDTDFSQFLKSFKLSGMFMQAVHNLGVGSGFMFNLASASSFRAPCYADAVITAVVLDCASTLAVCVSSMMACPYAYEYGVDPYSVLFYPISLMFEKTPRFLFEYDYKYFHVVLVYSCHTVLGTGTNMILILHMVEMIATRSERVANYPGLTSFFVVLCLFFISMPMMCAVGLNVLFSLRKISSVVAVFVSVVEVVVFVVWYGLDKFSEDVHFMQGLPPTNYMKICWMLSAIFLSYTFVTEIYDRTITSKSRISDVASWYMLLGTLGCIVLIFVLKLIVAGCRKNFYNVFRLDLSWGPKSEILQRSRAMFTARAMTKEYLYRQYHLQAGIAARQRTSNCRTEQQEH